MSVYFIQAGDTGLIKIGHARSVTRRLATLQTGSAHNLKVIHEMRGGFLEEQGLHGAFAKHRAHGEWFHPHPDILNWIAKFKGEKRPNPQSQMIGGLFAKDFMNRFTKFYAELINREDDDGKAARLVMRLFIEQDAETQAYIQAQKEVAPSN